MSSPAELIQGQKICRLTGDVRLLARLAADCPTRPVDWRWRRAGLLLDLGLRCRRFDDDWVREVKRYTAALGRCRGDAARRRLAARMPGVTGALLIGAGDDRVRWAVEARLLTGEAIDVVAKKLGLPVEAVVWFEALLFNVSVRLSSRGYLTNCALGEHHNCGPTGRGLGALWKTVALCGGAGGLDELIRATWDAAVGPDGAVVLPAGSCSEDGPIRMAFAAMVVPDNPGDRAGARALLRLAASERRYAARADAGGTLRPAAADRVDRADVAGIEHRSTSGPKDAANAESPAGSLRGSAPDDVLEGDER